MGCQSTLCIDCKNAFPACQLRDGRCGNCRAKLALQQPPTPTTPINPNAVRTY